MTTETHALYRFYSTTGQLLYVGITNNPGSRFQDHQRSKSWWPDVAGIGVEWHPSRDDVLAAEARAIEVEHPRHNKHRPSLRPKTKTIAQAMRPQRLVWVCDGCHQPIEDGKGYLHLEDADRGRAERTRPVDDPSTWRVDLSGWIGWTPARWQVHHATCDPSPNAGAYHFDVARARTHAHLLRWTAHLMGKAWLEATDWEELIERMAGVDA